MRERRSLYRSASLGNRGERRRRVVYLHGFNSSPASLKARLLVDYCHSRGLADVYAPALPYDPALAFGMLTREFAQFADEIALVIGSSLGGYYATALAERFDLKAALINPAVAPCDTLQEDFLGPQRNLYTGEEYEFTPAHVQSLREIEVKRVRSPENYFLLLQTGDEVLDYRHALKLYAGARLLVEEGGSHSFDDFAGHLPAIMQFAGLEQPNDHQKQQ